MNILEQIAENKRRRVAVLKKITPYHDLVPQRHGVRSFPSGEPFIIAECKKGSPSKGIIAEQYDPSAMARAYSSGGADAISVLTEENFFFGSPEDFAAVRYSVSVPVLRKDFILESYQVRETSAMGADAMLLIAALLDRQLLKELHAEAAEYGLTVLVEAHDEHEISTALECGAEYIGVNARDLKDFTVSSDRAAGLAHYIPADKTAVAESGITSVESLLKLRAAGYCGFLVGEHFMRSENPAAAVAEFHDAMR